ncbi:hypothetical protein ACA910_010287 [Epithemia clementina (nom. ined.)]
MYWKQILEWISVVLLFCLVFGMSATVDMAAWKHQLHNRTAILTGLVLQFGILPLLGFGVVVALRLDQAAGLTLLVVTTSPGGSYSNWWCSLFNGDLALSVTMTAISTLCSTVFMPLNLYFYTKWAYGRDSLVEQSTPLQWSSLILALMIVLVAVGSGLLASATLREAQFNARMNTLGNVAGIALVLCSAMLSNDAESHSRWWNWEWQFYVAVALPCVLALILANIVTTAFQLDKPERVTVSIECCYQNVGIATSVALTMFQGQAQARAVAVPFYYGIVEALVLFIYCSLAWQAGWTKAPRDTSLWRMLGTSYEVVPAAHGDIDPEYQQAYYYHSSESPPVVSEDPHHHPHPNGSPSPSRPMASIHNNNSNNINNTSNHGSYLSPTTTTISADAAAAAAGIPSSPSSQPQPDFFLIDYRQNKEFSPAL